MPGEPSNESAIQLRDSSLHALHQAAELRRFSGELALRPHGLMEQIDRLMARLDALHQYIDDYCQTTGARRLDG